MHRLEPSSRLAEEDHARRLGGVVSLSLDLSFIFRA
jgi:hypothetical protein